MGFKNHIDSLFRAPRTFWSNRMEFERANCCCGCCIKHRNSMGFCDFVFPFFLVEHGLKYAEEGSSSWVAQLYPIIVHFESKTIKTCSTPSNATYQSANVMITMNNVLTWVATASKNVALTRFECLFNAIKLNRKTKAFVDSWKTKHAQRANIHGKVISFFTVDWVFKSKNQTSWLWHICDCLFILIGLSVRAQIKFYNRNKFSCEIGSVCVRLCLDFNVSFSP